MASLNNFDATKIEPSTGFSPLPAGPYTAVITRSEMKTTHAGDGEMLQITSDVIEGPFAGRKIFDNLNLVNKSAQAVDIAQKTLSAICRAVGVLKPDDSAELHDRPLIVTVKIKDGRNQVVSYGPANGMTTPGPGVQVAAANTPALKPWQTAT
jgi:hypothetical protein